MNLFAFVCELVCIYLWIFETLLTWPDSRMHFFHQGTLCSQLDASLIFSQSHDCSPSRPISTRTVKEASRQRSGCVSYCNPNWKRSGHGMAQQFIIHILAVDFWLNSLMTFRNVNVSIGGRSSPGSPHTATIPFSSCHCSESKPSSVPPIPSPPWAR